MIYTIGHSTLTIPGFLSTLGNIDTVIDVRSHPASRWPQFNQDEMKIWLPNNHKKYEWWPELGGWSHRHKSLENEFKIRGIDITSYLGQKFPKQRIGKQVEGTDISKEYKPVWYNQGLLDFSWYMTLPEFISKANDLSYMTNDVAIMCAEALWWKCHRSMIADYLYYRGVDSIHLQPARVNHSKVIGNRIERYHPDVLKAWSNQDGVVRK